MIPPYFLCSLHESVTLLTLSPVYMARLEGKQRKFNGCKDNWIFTEWKPRSCTVKRKREFCFPTYGNRNKDKFISSKIELCVTWSLSLSSLRNELEGKLQAKLTVKYWSHRLYSPIYAWSYFCVWCVNLILLVLPKWNSRWSMRNQCRNCIQTGFRKVRKQGGA